MKKNDFGLESQIKENINSHIKLLKISDEIDDVIKKYS